MLHCLLIVSSEVLCGEKWKESEMGRRKKKKGMKANNNNKKTKRRNREIKRAKRRCRRK